MTSPRKKPGLHWGDEHGIVATVGACAFGWARYGKFWHTFEWPQGVAVQSAISYDARTKDEAIAVAKRLALGARQMRLDLTTPNQIDEVTP